VMKDWEACRKQLIATIQQIGQVSPDIVRGYRDFAILAITTWHNSRNPTARVSVLSTPSGYFVPTNFIVVEAKPSQVNDIPVPSAVNVLPGLRLIVADWYTTGSVRVVKPALSEAEAVLRIASGSVQLV
jgi:hypothetical protein